MATDSASPIYGLRLQATGGNTNSWGALLNEEALRLIEQGADGVASLSVSASLTLSATNFAANEARQRVLVLTGSPAADFTVTVPNRQKMWFVRNRTARIATFAPAGGSGVSVAAGESAAIVCDGTECALADDVTRAWVRAEILSAALSSELPSQAGQAGNVLTTDGSQASWSAVALGGGGTTIQAADSIALAADGPRLVSARMTVAGKTVALPDATGLAPGGPHFVLHNAGVHPIRIVDASGSFLRSLPAAARCAFLLVDASSAAGRWVALDAGAEAVAVLDEGVTVLDGTAGAFEAVGLDADRVLVAFMDGAGGWNAKARVVATGAAGSSAGPAVTFQSGSTYSLRLAALSAERALAVYQDAAPAATVCVLDLSAQAVAAGTPAAFDGSAQDFALATLGADRALVAYSDHANAKRGVARSLAVSAGAVSAGSVAVLDSSTVTEVLMAPLSANRALCAYTVSHATRRMAVLTESAGTVAQGMPITLADMRPEALVPVASDRVLAIGRHLTGGVAMLQDIAVSADALSAGTITVLWRCPTSTSLPTALRPEAEQLLLPAQLGGQLMLYRAVLDGGQAAARDSHALLDQSAVSLALVDLEPGRALLVFDDRREATRRLRTLLLGYDR